MCAGIGCFPNHFSSDDVRDDPPVMLFIQNSFYAFVKKNVMCSWYYLSTCHILIHYSGWLFSHSKVICWYTHLYLIESRKSTVSLSLEIVLYFQ